ncbi:MAG: hypothetical protein IJA47_04765, partial [Oscillospiraceae bacterium]|nr:hypothetical protein [Oscillospiraceae bacterium]
NRMFFFVMPTRASTSLIFTRTTASLANSINLPQGGKSIAYFILCVFFLSQEKKLCSGPYFLYKKWVAF